MRIVRFDPGRHDRSGFACGHTGLDDYLRRYIPAKACATRWLRFTWRRTKGGQVLGYYTLSAASLGREELPDDLARRLPKYPVPAVLIGRMASDRRARATGLRIDSRLLIHALKQALRAADTIGVQCVIVDSKPEAVAFYRRYGFVPLKEGGLKLYLPIGTIRKMEDS